MPTLSKSKIIAFRQCPKRLWLEVHRPELRQDSPATQASFQVGYQVGDIARRIYDPDEVGVCIDVTRDVAIADLRLDHLYVITPREAEFPLTEKITASGLQGCLRQLLA